MVKRRCSPLARAKDIPTLGLVPTPLLSHSARLGHRRDASREQANPSYGRQEVRERSLCNRRPRSLAALETTELLLEVKQVGSSPRKFQTSLIWVMRLVPILASLAAMYNFGRSSSPSPLYVKEVG